VPEQAPGENIMANTAVAAGLTVQQWDEKFYTEYIRANRFKKYMGTDENAIIQMKETLTLKPGKTDTFTLVNALTGAGKRGSATLVGQEEKMNSRSCPVTVDKVRNAVVVPEIDEQYSAISLRNASKVVLNDWILRITKNDIVSALGQVAGHYDSGFKTIWQASDAGVITAAQDAWVTANVDRVLFGSAVSNYSTTFATAVGNVDDSGDLPTYARLNLMKSLAKLASPAIRPTMVNGDEEWYAVFCGSKAFKRFSEDATIVGFNKDARVRGLDNPLFTGDSLIANGMIIREIPEIPDLAIAGGTSADVSPVFLCGSQALGFLVAQRSKTITDDTDYGDKQGCAIQEVRGIEKLRFGTDATVDTTTPKDNGIFTGFFACPALASA
jgi:N4-gp56 family major capsid protein